MTHKSPRAAWSTGAKMLVAIMLLLAVVALQFIYFHLPGLTSAAAQELRLTETGRYVAYDFDAGASFYSYNARYFYFCTRDGMQYMSANGDAKWNEIFTLAKPIMVGRGPYVAVGDAKGRHLFVYGAEGPLFNVAFDAPVLFFNINHTGYLSVILQRETGYEVRVYHQQRGSQYIYSNVIPDLSIHPTAVDVSGDGTYIAIAMLNLQVRMSSRTVFYYIKTQDAWYTAEGEGLIAGYEFPDELIYCLKFMADNRALVFTDTQIACYQPNSEHVVEPLWTVPMQNKVALLDFYGDSRFAFVTGEKLLNEDQAAELGTVQIYDVNGEKTGEFALGRKATYLSMNHNALTVGAGRSFYALNYHGSKLWEYVTLQDTFAFIFLDNTDTVLSAGANRADILKRTRPKASAAPITEEPLDETTPGQILPWSDADETDAETTAVPEADETDPAITAASDATDPATTAEADASVSDADAAPQE